MPMPDEFRELAAHVNNWGRWGDDDRVGTLNLITDDVVKAAAACVRTGKRFSLAVELREDGMAEARQAAREAVSVDLAPDEREIAGDLAAARLAANLAFSADATEAARQEARAAVEPVRVTVQPNEAVVRAGDPITTLDFEKLTELGLTEPAGEVLPFIGYGLVAALLAILLVGFLWRFLPAIWHRPRSLTLFLLILLVSATVVRIAGDRTIVTYLVPTSAAVMLTGLLLGGAAGGAMAIGLAVVAGLVNDAALGPAMYVAALAAFLAPAS